MRQDSPCPGSGVPYPNCEQNRGTEILSGFLRPLSETGRVHGTELCPRSGFPSISGSGSPNSDKVPVGGLGQHLSRIGSRRLFAKSFGGRVFTAGYPSIMAQGPIPKCGSCGSLWSELPTSERASPPPCPVCGSEDKWEYHVDLRGSADGTSSVEGSVVKVINEGVHITDLVTATVRPETFKADYSFPPATIRVAESG